MISKNEYIEIGMRTHSQLVGNNFELRGVWYYLVVDKVFVYRVESRAIRE